MSDAKVVPITKASGPALRDQVQRIMDQRGISQGTLAEETGISRSVISTWLAGKYGHQGAVAQAMDAWIARQTYDGQQFLDLRNAKKVFAACEFAMVQRRIALIVGRPGLGKTIALQEFHRRAILAGQEVLYHHVSPLIRAASLVRMLARRFERVENKPAFDLLESVAAYLRRRPAMLLFDEANECDVRCLEVIRYLYDTVRVPVVLCGSRKLQRTLTETSDRFIELEQLQSRIGLKVVLEAMAPPEVKSYLASSFASMDPAAAKLAHTLSRGVVRDLAQAAVKMEMLMERHGLQELTEQVVRDAFEYQLL